MSVSYERMNYVTSFGFSIRWRTQFLDAMSHKTGLVEVLDLLTGMGETWDATKKKFPESNFSVLDFSEGMLKYAKTKSRNNDVTILQQNVLDNQLPDAHYDYVTCAFGLKTFHEEQLKTLAAQVKRILKPGGQFSFIEVSKPENKTLKFFYGLYLGKIVPVLGRVLLGNPREYRMLWEYTKRFGNAKTASEIFREEGLKVKYHSYFYGCATGFAGSK